MAKQPTRNLSKGVGPVFSKRTAFLAFTFFGISHWQSAATFAQEGPVRAPVNTDAIRARLNEVVPQIRAEKRLIGLGVMITIDGKMVAAAVDGERRKGSGVQLTIEDRWHLGSVTKSMTATMIATLVEQRQLDWTATVGDCFGDSIDLHADCRNITLEQLLTHTSGLRPNFPLATQFRRPPEGQSRVEARRMVVSALLKQEPRKPPGTAFGYSNAGYTVAAAMAENRTGKSWEDLVRQYVFVPLNLHQAGFGPPKTEGTSPKQPSGHRKIGPLKIAVGEDSDNSPIIGPAGSIHMSLTDLCAFGNEHLSGGRGKGKLLMAATYKRLHTPRLNNYAFGWVVPEKNKWTDERLVWHNGSNTMWYTLLALLPESNTVIAVTSNDGDIKHAEPAAFQIVKEFATLASK